MKSTAQFAWVTAISYTVFSVAIMSVESKLAIALIAAAFVAVVSGAFVYYAVKGED